MSAEMADPDPLEVLKKHGKAVVEGHLKQARERTSEIKQQQWEMDQVMETIDNRIQGLSKGQRKVAGDGVSKEEIKAYTFLKEILDQEGQALEPLDYIVIAVNLKNPSQVYENTSSTIFDFNLIREDPTGLHKNPEALVDRMKSLLAKQPTYVREGKVRFREPRLKGTAEREGVVINIFYTTAPGARYLSLFDHDQTRAFLKSKGYVTAFMAASR
jgi:hypothetical protein